MMSKTTVEQLLTRVEILERHVEALEKRADIQRETLVALRRKLPLDCAAERIGAR